MSRQKRTTKLLIAVGLAAALLTTAGVAFGTDGATAHSEYDNLGTLDLIMNDGQGDKFVFTPTTGSVITQTLGTAACRINPASGSLVSLTANGDNKAGLKDHVIGVKAKSGEGNGTPCARINNSFDTNPTMAEILTIEFKNSLATYQADYAQLGLKLKFGATARIDVYSGATLVQSFDIPCLGTNDCGADSGNDRVLAKIDPAGNQRFNKIVIKVLSPSDGSVSLIDDPGFDTYFSLAGDVTKPVITLIGANPLIRTVGDLLGDPGATVTDNLDMNLQATTLSTVPVDGDGKTTTSGTYSITYSVADNSGNVATPVVRTVIVYDGTLFCGEVTDSVGSANTMAGTFKRLDNQFGTPCALKPYNLSVSTSGDTLTFDPDDPSQQAIYSGIISSPPKNPANPTAAKLEYDPELDGSFVNMKWCDTATTGGDGYVSTASLPSGEAWCIAAENSVVVGPNGKIRTTWTVYGHDDPIFRGN